VKKKKYDTKPLYALRQEINRKKKEELIEQVKLLNQMAIQIGQ
jgi:hypothetical protein